MISQHQLQKAANKGIITDDQVEPLTEFLINKNNDPTTIREEPLKFVRSFGDIFIALGIILLATTISLIEPYQYEFLIPILGFILIAEWLVRIRNLVLPGMIILISIIFFSYQALSFDGERILIWNLALIAAISLIFFLRYKIPFSLYPLAAATIAIPLSLIGPDIFTAYPIIFTGFGLCVFSIAMWLDAQDTKRQTRLSDNAFWLHLLASPLIVHGIMLSILFGQFAWLQSSMREVIILVFFLVFLLLSLLLDRRAILASTQLYIIYVLFKMVDDGLLGDSLDAPLYILMGLGLSIIFLGSFWYKARRLIFGFLHGSRLSHHLPDLMQQDNKKQ